MGQLGSGLAQVRGIPRGRRSRNKITFWPPGAWGRRPPAKPANQVTTGSTAELSVTNPNLNPNPNPENLPRKGKTKTAKPANEVTTGFGVEFTGVALKNHTLLHPLASPSGRPSSWA